MGLGGDQGGAASPGNDANLDSAEPAPCGRLNILFLIAGTRGDVQPAATLAAYLQARFGHVVRFATHTVHRQLVAARPYSLDFFPLAGDPQALTELAIRHRGMIPTSLRDCYWIRSEYAAIIKSTYEAATAGVARPAALNARCGDNRPLDSSSSSSSSRSASFAPDLIIANPLAYGQVHVAEALSCPLHLITSLPWTPTTAFAHPWARFDLPLRFDFRMPPPPPVADKQQKHRPEAAAERLTAPTAGCASFNRLAPSPSSSPATAEAANSSCGAERVLRQQVSAPYNLHDWSPDADVSGLGAAAGGSALAVSNTSSSLSSAAAAGDGCSSSVSISGSLTDHVISCFDAIFGPHTAEDAAAAAAGCGDGYCQPPAGSFPSSSPSSPVCSCSSSAATCSSGKWWQLSRVCPALYRLMAQPLRACLMRWCNWCSTLLLDFTVWAGIADILYRFRTETLGLPPSVARFVATSASLYRLPTLCTFSPRLLPRPTDWPDHISVCGPLSDLCTTSQECCCCCCSGSNDELLTAVRRPIPLSGHYKSAGSTAACSSIVASSAADCSGVNSAAAAVTTNCADSGGTAAALVQLSPSKRPVIYIGFGSMVVGNKAAATAMIASAVQQAGAVHALVSRSCWDRGAFDIWRQRCNTTLCNSTAAAVVLIDEEEATASSLLLRQHLGIGGGSDAARRNSSTDAAALIQLIDDIPHEQLFPLCDALVHHGGVGTVTHGLLAGVPMFVVPFCGDQFFWADVLSQHYCGAGPAAVPFHRLNADLLAGAIRSLLQPRMRQHAGRVQKRLTQPCNSCSADRTGRAAAGELQQRQGLAAAAHAIHNRLSQNAVLQRRHQIRESRS